MLIMCERVANRLTGLCLCGPNRWRSTLNLRKLSENKRIIIFASIWMSVLLISIIIKRKGVVAFLCSCSEIFPGYEDSPNFSPFRIGFWFNIVTPVWLKHKDTLWINYTFAIFRKRFFSSINLGFELQHQKTVLSRTLLRYVSFIIRE